VRKIVIIGLSIAGSIAFAAKNKPAKTLEECFQAALKRSEKVGVQDELLVQTKEGKTQAIGGLFPTISGTATYLHQPSPAELSATSPADQNTVKLSADQPLFRGLREFATIRQKDAQVGMQKFALQDAARQLFYDTTTAYYNVLALESDKNNYLNEIDVNNKRLKELQNFLRIGRSRLSEVLTQKANISSLEAQLMNTRGQLENAKEILAFLTGLDRDLILQDTGDMSDDSKPLPYYLAKIEDRPDIKTAAESVHIYDEGISIAFGQHLPSIDLIGDYYPVKPGTQAQQNVNWDVQLVLSMPIFEGGVIQSQVRQATSVERQYELQLSQVRRSAEQEVRQFYDNFAADKTQVQKLDETVDLSKRNYEAELQDYRNGLVTNLDVLQAITTWQDAERASAHQKFVMKLDHTKLEAAAAQRKEIFISSTRVDTKRGNN